MDSRLPLAFVLTGGPTLARHLAFHGLQELRQRLLFIYPFQGLTREEMQPYLEARLRYAGCDRMIFVPEVVDDLYRYSQGLPRQVNQLANLCLIAAGMAGKHLVDSSCVRQALAEMGLSEDSRRESLPVARM